MNCSDFFKNSDWGRDQLLAASGMRFSVPYAKPTVYMTYW